MKSIVSIIAPSTKNRTTHAAAKVSTCPLTQYPHIRVEKSWFVEDARRMTGPSAPKLTIKTKIHVLRRLVLISGKNIRLTVVL